jgi:hypothetical protein
MKPLREINIYGRLYVSYSNLNTRHPILHSNINNEQLKT